MLALEHVHKSYGKFHAVRDVSFNVGRGEIVGLLGPNGAGKTTIMRILTGYHYPSSGTVEVDGLDIHLNTREIKRRIGYLPENAPVYGELTVAEYLEFQARVRIYNPRDVRGALDRAVENCGLESVYNRPVSQLSKGFRQRVGLAQAIVHDPAILILDEPTSGLDPNQIQEIRSLIRSLGREKTIILSTHIMQEVEALCRRVLILNNGRIAAQGDTAAIGRELKREEVFVLRFKELTEHTLEELRADPRIAQLSIIREGQLTDFEAVLNPGSIPGDEFLFSWAVKHSVILKELTPRHLSLEDIFTRLTREVSQ